MTNRQKWSLLVVTVLMGFAFGATAIAQQRTLTGTVVYRERMALPANAVLRVKLVDVSLVDAPSKTVAEAVVNPAGQVPVRYQLQFDASQILPGRAYALQATITIDDRLWFTNTKRHAIFAGGPDKTEIVVQRAQASPNATPVGHWLAEDIGGGGVIDRLQSVVEIAADGTVSGSGGCNGMRGKAVISGEAITFGPIATTNKACSPAVMDQEAKFFNALRVARKWRIDPVSRKLTLLDADGKPVVVLAAM